MIDLVMGSTMIALAPLVLGIAGKLIAGVRDHRRHAGQDDPGLDGSWCQSCYTRDAHARRRRGYRGR